MGRIVAILGGGDWVDASVEHLVIPDGMDLEKEKAAYDKWYRDEYYPGKSEYVNFAGWLRQRGARDTTKDEILEFWAD